MRLVHEATTCDECNKDTDRSVELQSSDANAYVINTLNICQECAASAVELFLEDNYNEHS